MKIEDQRKPKAEFVLIDESRICHGDVVESEAGVLFLVVWADGNRRPYSDNPGYKGLVSLSTYRPLSKDAVEKTRIRKVDAKLVIEKESEQTEQNAVPTSQAQAQARQPVSAADHLMAGQVVNCGGYPIHSHNR